MGNDIETSELLWFALFYHCFSKNSFYFANIVFFISMNNILAYKSPFYIQANLLNRLPLQPCT